MSNLFEIRAQMTGPGGPFEIVEEDVDGLLLPMYKDRLPHLRAVAEMAGARGDDVELLVYGDERIGYGSFFAQANSVSAGLAASCQVTKGDKVAILSQNNPAWALGFWGTVNLGAVLVGLNGWWKTEEVIYGLQDSGAKVLIADKKRFDRVADRLDECPDLEWIYLADAEVADYDDARIRHFDDLRTATDMPAPTTDIAEADHAVIFYTSGTTGKPKGAISTHRSMICNMQNTFFNSIVTAMVSAEDMLGAADTSSGTPKQTASLMTSPLFHVSGCHSGLVVGTAGGLKIVMCEGKFEPDKVLGLIQDENIKIWATVPTMVWRVCEFPGRGDYDTSTVTSVAFGGSPSADELQRKVLDTFPNVSSTSNAYGLTESSSVATVIGGPDALAKPTSVGPPVPTVRIKTVDAEGNETAPFSPGEVLIQGPILMAGYHNKPEATAETIIDGWLHTGDIGHLDDEGFLYITDRAKDMIIRGGENIYCVEIENRLVAHVAIADAAIIGVPHGELGEEVKAVIQIEGGHTLTEAEVKAWVAETLANFKVPAYIDFTADKLPRNASGKLLKNVLRGEGEVSFSETM